AEDESRGEAGEGERDEEQRPLEPSIDGYEDYADDAEHAQDQTVKNPLRRDRRQGGRATAVVPCLCRGAVRAQELSQPGGQEVVAHETDQDQSQRVPKAEAAFPDSPPRSAEQIAGHHERDAERQLTRMRLA